MTLHFAAHILLLFPALFVAGCASPGTPKPPSLHLAQVVSDLAAEREGETVRLHWTTPSKTTDRIDIRGNITAQICRRATRASADCSSVHRLPVKPGPSQAIDVLPAALAQGPGAVLEYQVELLNSNERSAGFSPPAFAAAGASPPKIEDLRAEASPEGALLRWQPEDAADGIQLKRMQITPPAAAAKHPAPGIPAQKEPSEVRLRVGAGGTAPGTNDRPFLADAGGTVDTTAVRGETYSYTAQRVRRVVLDGHALELRSASSPLVTVTMRDTFPPRAPKGLEAAAARIGDAPAIDLSWTPNTEDNLAGYIVYRRQEAEQQDTPLAPSIVLQPAYRDTAVSAGRIYIYTVRAVDRTGNRSAPSLAVRESVTPP